jgi:hypothetical protein
MLLLAGRLEDLPLSGEGCVLMKSIAYGRSIRKTAVTALWSALPDPGQRSALLFLLSHDVEMGQTKWWLTQSNAGTQSLQATLRERCQRVADLRERRGDEEDHA